MISPKRGNFFGDQRAVRDVTRRRQKDGGRDRTELQNIIFPPTTPPSKLTLCHPLTATVPFVATRHFPAPRGITPDKGRLLEFLLYLCRHHARRDTKRRAKPPSDEGGGKTVGFDGGRDRVKPQSFVLSDYPSVSLPADSSPDKGSLLYLSLPLTREVARQRRDGGRDKISC